MEHSLDVLKNVRVASPCHAPWHEMQGNDRVRFCGECKLNVYNLSDMARDDAARLVESHEGRLCVRFFQRLDGTIITRDCPVGVRLIWRGARRIALGVAALLACSITAFGWSTDHRWTSGSGLRTLQPFAWIAKHFPQARRTMVIAGAMVAPPRPLQGKTRPIVIPIDGGP